jgi:hypothetical protein
MASSPGAASGARRLPDIRPRRLGRRLIGRLIAAMGLVLLSACGSPKSYRVRMTVDVDTPQGVRSGSGVFEILAGRNPKLLPDERAASVALRGEAVPIDLPGGQTLFALLRPANDAREMEGSITGALDPEYRGGAEQFLASMDRLSAPAMIGRSAALPPESYPLLVRFRDPAVPASVEAPEAGIQIRAVRLVITDEPVTRGIERRLAWVDRLRTYLSGQRYSSGRDLAHNLTALHFKRGN